MMENMNIIMINSVPRELIEGIETNRVWNVIYKVSARLISRSILPILRILNTIPIAARSSATLNIYRISITVVRETTVKSKRFHPSLK